MVETAQRSILIVEDEADLAELVALNLQREGYICRRAFDGETALAEIRRQPPALIILDRMLPGKSGDEVIAQLRRDPRTSSIPVLMLTARADETDELVGLALGADDYITKPFSMKRLIARIAAIRRRADAPVVGAEVLTAGPVRLDTGRHEVTVEGTRVELTATQFRLLKSLMLAGGRVLVRDQLIDQVLGRDVAVTDRTMDVHIAGLRKKLGVAAGWIQTVRGAGYAFRDSDSGDADSV